MNIATIFSPNWMHYFHVFLYSLFKNNKSPIKVYLMSDDMTDLDKNKANNICDYFGEGYTWEYIDVGNLYNTFMINNKNVDSRFTKYTLFKILIPYIISDRKLAFLDGDTIVLSNILEFYNQSMNNAWMSGCIDTGITPEYKQSIGMNHDDIYLNAGVLKFDLDKIRQSKIADVWMNWVNNVSFPDHEQCILNKSLHGRIQIVSPEYNVSLSTSLDFKPDEIKILHMAGVKNPWVKDIPFSELWYQVEQEYKSIFNNYKLKIKIPKVINYVWLGRNEKPRLIQECIDSWKRNCPDYIINEINEDNFDINSHPFLKSAYENKKYAFCNDYIRVYTLYNLGGIFLDSDVFIEKSLDQFLYHSFFTGQEINNKVLCCATMGAEKNHPICKMLLDYYDCINFDNNNLIPNTQFITEIFKLFIKEKKSNGEIILHKDCHLYPSDFFCSYDHLNHKIIETPNSHTYHMFQGSWIIK